LRTQQNNCMYVSNYPELFLCFRLLRPCTIVVLTGVTPICSGCVNGSWSRVALAAKCRPLFKHNAVLFKHVISPSSNTVKKPN